MTTDTAPFANFIAPATARPQIWRIVLGLLLILFVYLGVFGMMAGAAFAVLGQSRFLPWIAGLQAPDTPGHVLFLLATFAGMFLGPVIATGACHYRSPLTLFGPLRPALRSFGRAALVLVPLYAVVGVVGIRFIQPEQNLQLGPWLRVLPLALPLVLLQITAEELIFRGYLPQQLAARFRAKWVWVLVPALVFASLHYNPSAGAGAFAILLAIFVFALVAMDLTAKTGNLGAAMAFHFVNNCFAMLIMSVKGTITGLALYVTPFGIEDTDGIGLSTALDIAILLVIWRLVLWAVRR